MEPAKKLERFDVLVHPFYDARRQEKAEGDVKYMAGAWGKRVKEISEDPGRILIVYDTFAILSPSRFSPRMKYHIQRFNSYLERILGDRVIFCDKTTDTVELSEKLEKRGLSLDDLKKAEGRIFGEAPTICVTIARRTLQEALGKDLVFEPRLSVEGVSDRGEIGFGSYNIFRKENKWYGSFRHQRRATARKEKRLSGAGKQSKPPRTSARQQDRPLRRTPESLKKILTHRKNQNFIFSFGLRNQAPLKPIFSVFPGFVLAPIRFSAFCRA
ncbi:MAG: hypothetical protein V1493_01220 [Candidatus Diapherotrites archaeon]